MKGALNNHRVIKVGGRAVESSAKHDEANDTRQSKQPYRTTRSNIRATIRLDGTRWREGPSSKEGVQRRRQRSPKRRVHGSTIEVHGERGRINVRLCCLPSQFVRLDRQFDANPHLEVIEPQWARRIANSRSHRGCEKMRVEIVHTASGDGSDPCVSPRCAAAQPEALPPCSTNIPHVAASKERGESADVVGHPWRHHRESKRVRGKCAAAHDAEPNSIVEQESTR